MTREIAAALKDVREAFENWYTKGDLKCPSVERSGDGYKLMQAHQSWIAWEASWNAALESQLADAKPVGFLISEYGRSKLSLNPPEIVRDGLTSQPVYLHPPTAHLAGPGDEARCEALVKLDTLVMSAYGVDIRDADEIDAADSIIRAALQTPAVPAGVTVQALCEAVVDLAKENAINLRLYKRGRGEYPHVNPPANITYAATIAAAQEIVRKR